MKRCYKCGETKPVEEFNRDKQKPGGRSRRCRECNRVQCAAWYARHPENANRVKRAAKRWKSANREKVVTGQRRYDAEHREETRHRGRAWQKANPARVAAKAAAYLARKSRQTIRLTPQQEAEIAAKYEEARKLSAETGVPHDVDHIVPLNSRTVCGLHVPWNLRPLPAVANKRKGNKLTPEASA